MWLVNWWWSTNHQTHHTPPWTRSSSGENMAQQWHRQELGELGELDERGRLGEQGSSGGKALVWRKGGGCFNQAGWHKSFRLFYYKDEEFLLLSCSFTRRRWKFGMGPGGTSAGWCEETWAEETPEPSQQFWWTPPQKESALEENQNRRSQSGRSLRHLLK